MSMEACAWRFTCQAEDCNGRTWQGRRHLEAKGTKTEAVKTARAAGWTPCAEALGLTKRSLATWYCPACTSMLASRRGGNLASTSTRG